MLNRHFGILALLVVAGCEAGEVVSGGPQAAGDVGDNTPLEVADDSITTTTIAAGAVPLAVGDSARVCNASALNQRSGPGTSYSVLRSMPADSTVKITQLSGTWAKNDWGGRVGWSSTTYLCKAAAPGDPGQGTPTEPPATFDVTTPSRDGAISIAKAAVGFSYFWGGGRFKAGAPAGSCYGSCPNCSHDGSYGADCSGFVGKAWLLPESLPMDSNKHPFSTDSFYNGKTHWSDVARSSVKAGDALVYRSGGSGHIALYEKGDPWGQSWLYEARGCSYGVVHDLRTLSSSYKGIKRTGF